MSDPGEEVVGPQAAPSAAPGGGAELRQPAGEDAPWDEVARATAGVLAEIAHATADLSGRIEQMSAAIEHALDSGASPFEVDKFFVQAQEFIDRCIAEAHRQAARVLADAHAQADQIVMEGLDRTRQLIGQAPLTAFMPTEALQQLEDTIDSFSQSNTELMSQLASLRERRRTDTSTSDPEGPRSDEPPPLSSRIA